MRPTPSTAPAGEPWSWPATALAAALARREVSATEAVAAHLARISAIDPQLAAFVTVAADPAQERAARLDRMPTPLGPLHGMPIAIKDLTDVAGMRTTYGSALYAGHVPTASDAVVERLERAGAIIVGKTNTPEFGFGAICTNALLGPTRNPHDETLTSGGSSGGAAVAVATGMVPLAHGTDFGGSVRTPAGFCGVASIRPTPGLVPAPGRALGFDTLATHGVLARSVADAMLMLSAIAGPDPRDPVSLGMALGRGDGDGEGPIRIAAVADFGVAPVADEVRGLFDRALAVVAQAVGPVARSTPECGDAIAAFRTLRAAHIRHQYGPLAVAHGERLSASVRWNVAQGEGIGAQAYLEAQAARTALYRRFVAFFERHDVLVAPAASVQPWPNDAGEVSAIDGRALASIVDYLAVTFIVSLAGMPVVTVPAAWTDTGLPFGIQLIGPPGSDARLAAIAMRFERAAGFVHRWPRRYAPAGATHGRGPGATAAPVASQAQR